MMALNSPYSIFDRLRKVDQGQIVNNKRLGAVLSYVKTKQEVRDEKRSQRAPSRLHLGLDSTTQIRASSSFQE